MAPGILRKSPLPEGRTLDNDAKKEFGRSVDRVSPDELTEPSTEPIAIIGIGKYPNYNWKCVIECFRLPTTWGS